MMYDFGLQLPGLLLILSAPILKRRNEGVARDQSGTRECLKTSFIARMT